MERKVSRMLLKRFIMEPHPLAFYVYFNNKVYLSSFYILVTTGISAKFDKCCQISKNDLEKSQITNLS